MIGFRLSRLALRLMHHAALQGIEVAELITTGTQEVLSFNRRGGTSESETLVVTVSLDGFQATFDKQTMVESSEVLAVKHIDRWLSGSKVGPMNYAPGDTADDVDLKYELRYADTIDLKELARLINDVLEAAAVVAEQEYPWCSTPKPFAD